MEALDKAGLPHLRVDAGQVALFMGIASACSEWIMASAGQTNDDDEAFWALMEVAEELDDRISLN